MTFFGSLMSSPLDHNGGWPTFESKSTCPNVSSINSSTIHCKSGRAIGSAKAVKYCGRPERSGNLSSTFEILSILIRASRLNDLLTLNSACCFGSVSWEIPNSPNSDLSFTICTKFFSYFGAVVIIEQ